MVMVRKIKSVTAHISKALKSLSMRYEKTPPQAGEKHKLYRSIILLKEELNKLEENEKETAASLCK
jgi:hypothetical protein